MDKIKIENLEIFAHHGVFAEEKEKGQHFYINATLFTDLKKAGRTDNLYDSTHYGEVCLQIKKSMTEETFDLIERAAQKTVEDILFRFPLIQEVTLEVRKPQAPIPMKFQSVSVELTRGWHKTYIAFGSNMGERDKYIKNALEEISKCVFFKKVKGSDIYKSAPYGGVEQDEFLNGVIEAETIFTPRELLEYLQELEQKSNRVRLQHWGPRTLDLDIIFYDDLIVEEEDLMIPHRDMKNRDFVLQPLAQLAPYKRHPILGITVEEMLDQLKERYISE